MLFQRIFSFVVRLPRQPFLWLIFLYQKTLSPDHGWFKARYPYGFCRFQPSCSAYSYQVIKKRGIIIGVPLSVWRIMRCNPWNKGGIDFP